ncbi:MAG: hypothetical protein VW268_02495 [Rhodospirillaceae bacterium]
MKTSFHARVIGFTVLREIEGARTPDHYRAMLDAMDYGYTSGMSDTDLKEKCLLSLQDREPDEAAYVVLKQDLGGVLRDGQLQNITQEMMDEKMWEEYATPAFHERLFIVGCLLHEAMPSIFPEPDAVRVRIEVTAKNAAAGALLTDMPKESFLVRLLAHGMENDMVLHRLYGDELASTSFSSTDEVVWTVRTEPVADGVTVIDVIGSDYWLGPLRGTKSYSSAAYADPA